MQLIAPFWIKLHMALITSKQSKLEVFDSNIFPLMHTATLCLYHTYCARQSFVGTQETVSVWEMQTPQPQTVQFCNASH